MSATLQAQLIDQPRTTVEDAAKALSVSEEKQKALEADLQQHQDYIQDVIVYQRAHTYWSEKVLESPGPTCEGFDDRRSLNISGMTDAVVDLVHKQLRCLSANGEDKADLPSLRAHQVKLLASIEEVKKEVQQASERLATEQKLSAIVDAGKRLVDIASI